MADVWINIDYKQRFSDWSVTKSCQHNDTHADGIGNGANSRNIDYIKYRVTLTSETDNKK